MGPPGWSLELALLLCVEDFREGRPLHFTEKQEDVKLRSQKGKSEARFPQKAECERNRQ